MAFSSYVFLLAYLPITMIGYFFVNRFGNQAGKVFLIGASVIFYSYKAPDCFLVICGSMVLNWSCYQFVKRRNGRFIKIILTIGILANVLTLFVFKYYNFFAEQMNHAFHMDMIFTRLAVPLGISFFTFSQISFLIDGYRGEFAKAGLTNYVLYVLFFPKVVSGPIAGFAEMSEQFDDHERKRINWENVAWGLETFILGMGKKVLLADVLSRVVNYGFENVSCMNLPNSLIVMLCFTFEIYFDFSGYCDMAVGVAKILNIELPVNFWSPYRAINIKEFWKRWHITLTRFLTKYIYIPLGGSRAGAVRKYLNIMIVFLISGIWHGANVTFVVWGALHGLARCFYEKFSRWIDRIPRVIQWAGLFLFLNVTWFIFRADSITQLTDIVSGWKLKELHPQFVNDGMLHTLLLPELKFLADALLPKMSYNSICYLLFELLIVVCFLIVLKSKNNMERKHRQNAITAVMLALLLCWCTISFGSVNSFIYESF